MRDVALAGVDDPAAGVHPNVGMPAHHRGYTLLEILVVLALLGLLTGLAVPRLDRMFDSLRMAFERDDVLDAIADLPYLANRQGMSFELTRFPPEATADPANPQTVPLQLPDGWIVRATQPIRYAANGVCGGGELMLQYAGQQFEVDLEPPLCRPPR